MKFKKIGILSLIYKRVPTNTKKDNYSSREISKEHDQTTHKRNMNAH